jgi:hypothetical protein
MSTPELLGILTATFAELDSEGLVGQEPFHVLEVLQERGVE